MGCPATPYLHIIVVNTSPEYSTRFEPVLPQYKKLKNGEIVSLTLKITDQAGKVITDSGALWQGSNSKIENYGFLAPVTLFE